MPLLARQGSKMDGLEKTRDSVHQIHSGLRRIQGAWEASVMSSCIQGCAET